MKSISLFILLLVSIGTFAQKAAFNYATDYPRLLLESKDKKSKLNYQKLFKRFKTRDTTLNSFEVLTLLIGFTDTPYFHPYSALVAEKEIVSLTTRRHYEEALQKADSLLYYYPFSQQTILAKFYIHYHSRQHPDSTRYYGWQFGKIMEAMAQSGDGFTPETAFFALGPADGHNFIFEYLRGQVGTMSSGRDRDGNLVDILQIRWHDKETNEKTQRLLYFQIEHAAKTLFKPLAVPENKEKKKKK